MEDVDINLETVAELGRIGSDGGIADGEVLAGTNGDVGREGLFPGGETEVDAGEGIEAELGAELDSEATATVTAFRAAAASIRFLFDLLRPHALQRVLGPSGPSLRTGVESREQS